MARPSKLPIHPRTLVMKALRKSKTPLTAYTLLEKLEPNGVKSAPIVYRALNDLEKQGMVHKIQAIGAYVACNCSSDHSHNLSVLTICGDCKQVNELHDYSIIHHLEKLRKLDVNLPSSAVIELPIICEQCSV